MDKHSKKKYNWQTKPKKISSKEVQTTTKKYPIFSLHLISRNITSTVGQVVQK